MKECQPLVGKIKVDEDDIKCKSIIVVGGLFGFIDLIYFIIYHKHLIL